MTQPLLLDRWIVSLVLMAAPALAACAALPASHPWSEPRLLDLKPGDEHRIGVKSIRWVADKNCNALIEADECEVRENADAAWVAMDGESYINLVQWRLLMQLDPSPSYVYRDVEGRELRLFVDAPADLKPGDRRPAALLFFGGSWRVGWQGELASYGGYLADRGLVSFRVDYRVGSRDGEGDNALRAVGDARAALRWVIANAERFGVDPDRLVTMGQSAGGHLAIVAALGSQLEGDDDPALAPHVKAIVAAFPVSEMIDRRLSPLHLLSRSMPPLFLTWGTQDVFAQKLDTFVARAHALSITPVVHIEPDAKHGFIMFGRHQGETLARIDPFLVSAGILSPGSAPTVRPDLPKLQSALWSSYHNYAGATQKPPAK